MIPSNSDRRSACLPAVAEALSSRSRLQPPSQPGGGTPRKQAGRCTPVPEAIEIDPFVVIRNRIKQAAKVQSRKKIGRERDVHRYRFLLRQGRAYERSLRKLQQLHGRPRLFSRAVEKHLEAYSTRISLAVHAATHKGNQRISPALLDTLARAINLHSRGEPRLIASEHIGRKKRELWAWSCEDYAMQVGVSDIIRILAPPSYNDFMVIGAGGSPALIRQARDWVRAGFVNDGCK